MKKSKRLSDPPRRTSAYPDSAITRSTRASSIFPYSTARPPTDYSAQSWLPGASKPPPLPLGPASRRNDSENPFEEASGEERGGETPLYARSDWDATTDGGRTPAKTPRPAQYADDDMETQPSAWSKSSFAGMTTGVPTTGRRQSTLGDIREEEESVGSEQTGWYAEDMVDSPGAMTTTPHTAMSPYSMYPQTIDTSRVQSGLPRRSTLPSVLELEDLVPATKASGRPDRPVAEGARPRVGYPAQPTPEAAATRDPYELYSPGRAQEMLATGMEIMTPEAHQRLGRMSVAQARNQPFHGEYDEKYPDAQTPTKDRNLAGGVKKAVVGGKSGLVRTYLTYRPFSSAALAMVAALLVTMSLQNVQGKVSRYVVLKDGAFPVYPKDVGDVGLGLNGWCQINGDRCEAYGSGDFASATYRIPGDETLYTLGDMLTALCAFTWLQALYLITTTFLHVYLYFSLSLSYSHILDAEEEMAESGHVIDGQAEVDIRIRCERPPWEGLSWVWWAWWAHRRAPLGPLFGMVTFVLSLSSIALAFIFKNSVAAAASGDVSLSTGAYVPVIVFLLTMAPTISGTKWFFKAASSWRTFVSPPPPSPAAILLPPESKPMTHVRPRTGASFFAPRRTPCHTFRASRPQTGITELDGNIPPVPGADLDEETRRWLMAYPTDDELVPLIADLRGGKPNDDFILSDVGLLYLRPSEEEEAAGAEALLVPPRGIVRREILDDAHNAIEGDDRVAHHGPGAMLEVISQTFWWHGMEEDARGFVEGCAGCAFDRGQGVGAIEGMKDGMTPVPFTGVTGWTGGLTTGPGDSAMAAEMAFAMRKAEQEAEQDALR